MDNVNLKRKGDAPEQTPEGKKPNKLVWLGVLALVVIGGIFGLKQLNQENPVKGGSEEVVTEGINTNAGSDEKDSGTSNNKEAILTADNTESYQAEVSNKSSKTNTTSSIENTVTSKPSTMGENSVANVKASNNASVKNGNQSNAAAFQGSVEEKANQVIRGMFGNGIERKQALGAEYEIIQSKVNEIYKLTGF
jgi:cytoskeletal protein RodZ